MTIIFEHHIGEDNRPITIRDHPKSGIGIFGEGFVLLHRSQNGSEEVDLEDYCQVMAVENSEPRDMPVSSDSGFCTLYPGQSIIENCVISPEWDYNLYGIGSGEKLTYLFQGTVVQWWDYGTIEVSTVLRSPVTASRLLTFIRRIMPIPRSGLRQLAMT